MNPPQPPPPSGWPAAVVPPRVPPAVSEAGGRKTLVGGFPWQECVEETPVPAGRPFVIDQRGPGPVDADLGIDLLSGRWLRRRLDECIRRSPPLTVSLSLHIVVLLTLAVASIRSEREKRPVLDLSFASTVIDREDKGVEIPPRPELVEAEMPEEAKTEEPPVEEPVAAPTPPPEVSEAPGAAAVEAAAPVIGTLLRGREEGQRKALVQAFGGSHATEAAVARALAWLVKNQGRDGLWSLQGPYMDGGSQENRLAATAMALLALQGAGNTHRAGSHRAAVTRATKALVARQLPEGNFDIPPMPQHHTLYAHAQATIALCELYGMTKDAALEQPAGRAVGYAVAAQGPDGGWRYEPGKEGDMSVTGWFLMGLKSAEMAGIEVPARTFQGIEQFLDRVAIDRGERYGYRRDAADTRPQPVTVAVSAEGLLCRQYLGWRRDDPRLVAGVELLTGGPLFDFDRDKDLYAWYYVTQVAHHMGGPAWDRWNGTMREVLPARQVERGREAGSWDPTLDKWGAIGGRLYATCFCTWMLEVYYRHLPLYGGPP